MTQNTSGFDQLRETVGKIKGGIKATEEQKKKLDELEKEVENSLVGVEVQGAVVDSDVADFYRKNARVGTENILRDSLPILKVTEALSKNLLHDDSKANEGSFYYTKTKEQFDELEVSIISVSKGYYTKPLIEGDKPVFTQIVSGMILEGMKPFIMYFTKTRLDNLWNQFGKAVSPYTKDKENPIPMMAIKVKLTTRLVEHKQGESHLVEFELMKDKNNHIQLITDIGLLEVIRGGVESVEEAVEDIIKATEIDRQTGELLRDNYIQDDSVREELSSKKSVQEIDDEDFPF